MYGGVRTRGCFATLLLLGTLLILARKTHAHAPGEEFTYLNMFRKHEATRGAFDTNAFVNTRVSQKSRSKPRHRRLHETKLNARLEMPEESTDEEEELPKPRKHSLHARRSILVTGESKQDSSSEGDETDSEENESNEDSEGDDDATDRESSSAKLKQISKSSRRRVRSAVQGETSGSSSSREVKSSTKSDDSNDSGDGSRKGNEESEKSHAAFEGIGGQKDGEDIKRVSFMLMRLLKQYKAESMVDVPCRAHSSWMHMLLQRVQTEIPGFRYYCVDTNKDILHALRVRVKGSADQLNARFVLRQFWSERLPRADFVFSWSGLEKMRQENVVKFLRNVASSGRHKYVILGNHMKGSKIPKKAGKPTMRPINVRNDPFHLLQPMRVVSRLSLDPVKKQMYLYKADEMSDEWSPKDRR